MKLMGRMLTAFFPVRLRSRKSFYRLDRLEPGSGIRNFAGFLLTTFAALVIVKRFPEARLARAVKWQA
jgi:hypothetical protein